MILRSFLVPAVGGALPTEGSFVARVQEFLGLAAHPASGGFAILTFCDEQPRAGQGILLPAGHQPAPEPGAQRWDFFVRVDQQELPVGRQVRNWDSRGNITIGVMQPRYLGAVALGDGVAFVFIAPHEAPEGAEFV